jgi:endonuclease/exonuclease/phosphatase family metal-dependent hydrolase
LQVARRLIQSIDSLRSVSQQALVMVAGDFNDFGSAPSLKMLEEAGLREVSRGALGGNGAEATYRHQGEWNMLDHIFASPTLVDRVENCQIFDAPFLLEPDETYGGVKPRRSYLGSRYLGGFSDHLPLVARFRLR